MQDSPPMDIPAPDATTAPFADLPVEVTVSVGRAAPTIRDLLALRPNSVIALDKSVDDPVEVFVGDRLVARGVLEEVATDTGTTLAVRLTDVPGLADG